MREVSDAHIHVFGSRGQAADEAADDYERIRDQRGVRSALVVGYEGSPSHAGNNAAILRLAKTRPWMKCVAFVSLRLRYQTGLLEELAQNGYVGISLYVETMEDLKVLKSWPPIDGSSFAAGFCVVSLNAPIHLLPLLASTISASVQSEWLVSHLGLPGPIESAEVMTGDLGHFRDALDLARLPNLGMKISGTYALGRAGNDSLARARIIAAYIDAFGVERLYWGSDHPVVLQHSEFPSAESVFQGLGLSTRQLAALSGRNLEGLL